MGIFETPFRRKDGNGKKKDRPRKTLIQSPRKRKALLFVFLYVASLALMGSGYLSRSQSLIEGAISPTTITASTDATYQSAILTEEARQKAISAINPVMTVDRDVLREIEEQIGQLFSLVDQARADYGRDRQAWEDGAEGPDGEAPAPEGYSLFDLEPAAVRYVLQADPVEIDMLREYVGGLVRKYMETGVQTAGLPVARQNMLEEVFQSSLPPGGKALLLATLQEVTLTETLRYDDAATSLRKEEVTAGVAPVVVSVRAGEILVQEGEIITPLLFEIITSTNTSIREETFIGVVAIALLLALLYGILIWFLFHYRPAVPKDENYLRLLVVLTLLGVVLMEVFAGISGTAALGRAYLFMTPLAAIAMLAAILLDSETALLLSTILALLLGVAAGFSMEFSLVAVLSGYVGVFSVARLRHRGDLMKSAAFIGGVNILSVVAVGWYLGYPGTTLLWAILLGVAGGLLSSVLAIGTLPYFEMLFKITTAIKLLEYADPSQPLLRKLLLEAPGTYHHSIMVGNLAEAAAEAVGADRLLARVGAFYHDIGKLRRPYFFIENQQNPEASPHEKLSPRLSTLIITSHVKDGLEMARENKLPPSLQQFIASHHGDSVVRFFFNKARDTEGPNIRESEFRYEGVRPVTREAAIVMLADTVEASVRTLKNPNAGRVEGFVRRIIMEKFEAGQLSEANITFRELEEIAKAFVRVLSGIYHQRVEYPEKLAEEVERRKDTNGNQHQ